MSEDWRHVEAITGLPAIEAISASLRFALRADDGSVYNTGDYSGIEARIVLALAGQYDKCDLLVSGFDVYLDMAEDIYNQPKGSWAVTDKALLKKIKEAFGNQRTIGKNTVLGCGFQMGKRTFHARYCKDQPEEFAETVIRAYRKKWAPKVPALWYALDEVALMTAITGKPHSAYGITYAIEGDWLTATLPSGWQKLWYYRPRVEEDERFDRQCWTYWASKSGKWKKIKAYGGLLTENAVQALARGLLCSAIHRLEQAHLPVVLTVHDECVCEVPAERADQDKFEAIMAEPTPWAQAMQVPISVEGWTGTRYRK